MAKMRAIGYVRVSTAEQVDGFGLDVQRDKIRAYCKEHGLRLVDVLADEGQSGSNGLEDRQGLAQALARIEAGDASALVVYRLDRLARDLILQETIHERLRSHGADVISASEPAIEGDDATRVMVRQILGVIAQYERTVIRGRMMAGKAVKVARGGYGGGRPAYGFRASDGELVPDPGEEKLLAVVGKLRHNGLSYREIAAELTAKGYKTRRGGPWHPDQIRRIALHA
ncbi:MAG: recombinase family protein [Acidimicrobiales bacterium]